MTLYKKYEYCKPIGTLCLSNWGGLEILAVGYDVDDYVIAAFNFGTRQQVRRHKIYMTVGGRQYIRKQGTRYYLDEIIRRRV